MNELFMMKNLLTMGGGVKRILFLLIPTYFRVPRVGNTDEIQTAAAGQTGRTPKTID